METFFMVCFIVGCGYVVISFLAGELLDIGDIFSGDFDVDFDGFSGASPFKPVIIAIFLAVFGGIGLILYPDKTYVWALGISFIVASIISYCMYKFVVVNMYNAQNTSAVDVQSLVGHTATVTEKIPEGKFGKITYVVNGNTYTAPAKSIDGGEISRGLDVKIVLIEKHIFFVRVIAE